jgi:periplasmic copper chaperone A
MRFGAVIPMVFLAVIGTAHAQSSADIEISHAWARATPASAHNGAIYLTITNHGKDEDRLTGASTPAAAKAELHNSVNDNGVMKMRAMDGVAIKPGGSAAFKPGGMHIMLVGLAHPLKAGDSFPVTLDFARAGAKTVTVMVEKPGATTPGDMPGMKM